MNDKPHCEMCGRIMRNLQADIYAPIWICDMCHFILDENEYCTECGTAKEWNGCAELCCPVCEDDPFCNGDV